MYIATINNQEEKFTSVVKAVKAIENYFQCGTEQTLSEIRKSLRNSGIVQVRHCMCENMFCWLEKC